MGTTGLTGMGTTGLTGMGTTGLTGTSVTDTTVTEPETDPEMPGLAYLDSDGETEIQ